MNVFHSCSDHVVPVSPDSSDWNLLGTVVNPISWCEGPFIIRQIMEGRDALYNSRALARAGTTPFHIIVGADYYCRGSIDVL